MIRSDGNDNDNELFLRNSCPAKNDHCVKIVRIQNFSGTHYPAFGLNTEIFSPDIFSTEIFSTDARKYGSEKLRIRHFSRSG